MNALVLGLLVIIMVGAAGFALAPAFTGGRADKRRKALQADQKVVRQAALTTRTRDQRRKTVAEALKAQNDQLNARKAKKTLRARLMQAGMTKTEPRTFVRNAVILGVALFVVCFVLQVPLLFAAVFGAAGAYVLPNMYLRSKKRRYQNAFLDELPNAVEAIVRGVKSGMPLNDSFRLVAREVKEPVKSEFVRILEQQAVGKTMPEAVETMFDRFPLAEVNFFIVVITVQQQSGGNLSEALGNLAAVLRNRKKMKMKVKAMSSEAKASAIIIGALPVFVAGAVSVISPQYLTPLITTNVGLICLGIAGIMLVAGVFIMNRMIQFDY